MYGIFAIFAENFKKYKKFLYRGSGQKGPNYIRYLFGLKNWTGQLKESNANIFL
jgi:hypothetical protein